jgi:hypothetical protein
MKRFLSIAFLLLCNSYAQARIGETLEECRARYGKEASDKDVAYIFIKDEFKLRVYFEEGKCVKVSYEKVDPKSEWNFKPLTNEEVDSFLKDNSGGKEWVKISDDPMKTWKLKDDSVRAFYVKPTHTLVIRTKDENQ